MCEDLFKLIPGLTGKTKLVEKPPEITSASHSRWTSWRPTKNGRSQSFYAAVRVKTFLEASEKKDRETDHAETQTN